MFNLFKKEPQRKTEKYFYGELTFFMVGDLQSPFKVIWKSNLKDQNKAVEEINKNYNSFQTKMKEKNVTFLHNNEEVTINTDHVSVFKFKIKEGTRYVAE